MEKSLLSSIIQKSSNGIIVIENGKVEYANPEADRIFQGKLNSQSIEEKLKLDSFKIGDSHYRLKAMVKEVGLEVIEVMDITSTIELEDKNCFYDVMLDNISNGVIMSDESGHIIEYNKSNEEFEGLKRKDVLGKKSDEVYDVDLEDSQLRKVTKSGKELLDCNTKYNTIEGNERVLVCSYFPVYKDSKVIGACGISENLTKVQKLLDRTLELQNELIKSSKTEQLKYSFENIIGESPEIKKSVEESIRASIFDSPILVVGDTGTGKELFVQSIHNNSKRAGEPFIPINCAAIPENLMESLLFGTVKGAFTGAENKAGLIEQAGSGTLYLDELNSMPINIQAKLLRVIQEQTVRRVGGKDTKKVRCRYIASINDSPESCIENNRLRDDLFYRLGAITIELPRLIDRKGDIPVLIEHFIGQFNRKYNCNIKGVSVELLEIFNEYNWPGNVRELQYVLEGSMCMDRDIDEIGIKHLPNYLYKKFSDLKLRSIGRFGNTDMHLNNILETVERETVLKCLANNEGNLNRTAKALGISRQNLHYRIRKHGLKKSTRYGSFEYYADIDDDQ
ncbi:arginine utilization regulatory protein [Dethiosulfatibacter aminovorans DSM 17477]|uniref:Arginine utilization regulatory protein n=1 Tax=Dethiosulfatibacter aminovorans DSM 17477 TaxID=1121476 RepID=A0A1M6MZK2_9FIRM|nr:sigma 54-interacting transcriptional regulator [Dethiosulfatibacter aminovorans]SHJ88935.1 arginine utilization regulatory protein [Dethiosulfatibacter aminovorans DSM 17477]